MNNAEKTAYLYSSCPPTDKQKAGFLRFVEKKYGSGYVLVWEKSDRYEGGFALQVGADLYDWSAEERVRQLTSALLKAKGENVITLLKEEVSAWRPSVLPQETGVVLSVGDGIAKLSGPQNATYGEILVFSSGVKGMVLSLEKDEIGCILFDTDDTVCEGDIAYRTEKTAGIPAGEAYIGRVVNALGEPIDGMGEIAADAYYPIERPAPDIIDRQPVNRPLETGLLVIDSMFPIGRGQRELIIGDRQTGKTAIAVDTIVNQKGKDVICIYVAIGQKMSSVIHICDALKKHDAMDYTVVMAATAGEAAPLQYVAPYAGCALAEYFMDQGKDVLIIYDDLSKHAVSYRSLSLLLNRSPGREAYPGDVFYLHSRLLERSAHLSDEKGGGSITALPIVETQAGDVSAYIPTNIISITDGQIYLESNLFFSGQRPAVNVGLSVSRVGGDAQSKAMKLSSGTLRLDLAQYREMEAFTQFANDLDESTLRRLAYGQGLMRTLRQEKFSPLAMHTQVILLNVVSGKLINVSNAEKFRNIAFDTVAFIEEKHPEIGERIEGSGLLSKEDKEEISALAKDYIERTYGE